MGEIIFRNACADISARMTKFPRAWPDSTMCTATVGTYEGGREKAPAAMCRKVIEAKLSGKHEIEIWGDGLQTRSFMYITDCLKGIDLITDSETWHDPINLGSDEGVTINQLVDVVEDIAGVKLKRTHNLNAPLGVNGRNSDNTLIKKVFGWAPDTKLRDGMEQTYKWIYDDYMKRHGGKVAVQKPAPMGAHVRENRDSKSMNHSDKSALRA